MQQQPMKPPPPPLIETKLNIRIPGTDQAFTLPIEAACAMRDELIMAIKLYDDQQRILEDARNQGENPPQTPSDLMPGNCEA